MNGIAGMCRLLPASSRSARPSILRRPSAFFVFVVPSKTRSPSSLVLPLTEGSTEETLALSTRCEAGQVETAARAELGSQPQLFPSLPAALLDEEAFVSGHREHSDTLKSCATDA